MEGEDRADARLFRKYDFGDKTIFQVEQEQFHVVRRLCERRISGILGEERTLELIRMPSPGTKPKFHYIIPPIESKRKGIFGMGLFTATKTTGIEFRVEKGASVRIPFIVEQCLTYLGKDDALNSEGIFRKPGNTKRMTELQLWFDTRPTVPVDFSKYTVHDVAGILKKYIREIPEPLFTLRLQNLFFATLELANLSRRLVCLQLLLIILPRHNRDLIQALLFFLKRISQNANIGNRMDSKNLAVVFAPNIAKTPAFLAQPKGAELTLKQAQEEGKESQELVELLIDHCEDLFSFQMKKIAEYPLSRGDTISKSVPMDERQEKPEHQVDMSTLTNSQRFLLTSKRSKEDLELMKAEPPSLRAERVMDGKRYSDPEARFRLTKTPSAPAIVLPSMDLEEGLDLALSPLPPMVRGLSMPQGLRPQSKPELHLESGLEEEEAEKETKSEGAELPDDDDVDSDTSSTYSDHDEQTDSPTSSTGTSGRVFEGKFMSRSLARRLAKDHKKRTVFVFGDITMKQAIELFKSMAAAHKRSLIDELPPVDFSLKLDAINIYDLCARMRDPQHGVEVKNRRKGLRVHKECFVGKEAIDWLCSHSVSTNPLSRLQAQVIAREMLEANLIFSPDHTSDFKDDHHFYRFFDSSSPGSPLSSSPMSPSPLSAPPSPQASPLPALNLGSPAVNASLASPRISSPLIQARPAPSSQN